MHLLCAVIDDGNRFPSAVDMVTDVGLLLWLCGACLSFGIWCAVACLQQTRLNSAAPGQQPKHFSDSVPILRLQ